MGEYDHSLRVSNLVLEALTQVVMVVGEAVGARLSDLRDGICGHIHPQAPQWGPIGHYYNTV